MPKGRPGYSSRPLNKNDVHQLALERFAMTAWTSRLERDYCISDRRFCYVSGAQWEGELFEQFADRPRLEVNKIKMSVMRIANEYRNNRMTVDFKPTDGSDGDATADFLDGAYRATEHDSDANEAYDNAFDEGVSGGMGAWRLVAKYEDEGDPECDNQIVRLEPITDADKSIFWDLQAKRQDKSDARYCFNITSMTHESFEETYGTTDFSTWPTTRDETTQFDWYTPDVVYVAEYFVVKDKGYNIHIYEDVDGKEFRHTDDDFEADPNLKIKLKADDAKFIKKRRITKKVIDKYTLSGGAILKGPERLPGRCIPIVPYYGQRVYIDNLERVMGHVRLAKDAQRLKNIQLSRLAELSIISPNKKPIFFPEQVAGHEQRWADDNLKNYAYQLINPILDNTGNIVVAGPTSYTEPPVIPPALAALLQLTESDMQDLLGNQQAGEILQPNTSGDAVSLVQTRLDMQTAIYIDNMKKAVKRSGEIWLSIVQDIYVEKGRKIKTMSNDGKKSSAELGKQITDPDTGKTYDEIDLTHAKCDVNVTVGPSSDSKRSATVKTILAFLAVNQDPEIAKVLTHTALMNMEGEGISDIRAFARSQLLAMGAVKPTDEEAQEIEAQRQAQGQQGPTPEEQYLVAEAEKSRALAQKAGSEVDYTLAKTKTEAAKEDKTIAEGLKVASEIEGGNLDRSLRLMGDIDARQQKDLELQLKQRQMQQQQQQPQPAQR